MSALSIVLAVLSAAFFAVAAVLQQKGTEGMSDDAAIGVGFVIALFQRKIWLAGLAANLAGFALQAGALAIGSLLLVQPFTVSTLLFALPLAAWTQKRRLQWREWMWAGVLVVGLVVFAVLGEPAAGITAPSFRAWILPLAVLAACAVLSMSRGARLPHGAQRSLVLALGAGVILGYSAPFTKTAMDALGDGLVRGLCSWELWAMIVASSVGTMWQQSSFQAGDVQTSLPAVTVLKPMVATAIGLTIYQEHLRIDRAGDVAVVAALCVMVVAAFALSRLSVPPEPAAVDAMAR
ncbi:DMT family transporter [Gordonia humi]|uniref:Putative membrane protein n=1 Tax=Gordonia humi TaxID=686429 RepID=A0A840FAQ2_9ACTN|nr:putative membrane protein [Gordonia humi]